MIKSFIKHLQNFNKELEKDIRRELEELKAEPNKCELTKAMIIEIERQLEELKNI